MRQRSLHALALVLLAGLVLVAVGCGGGGNKAAETTAPPAATTGPTSTETSTSALGGIASAANCKELADLGTRFSQALGGADSQDAKKVAQLLQEVAAKAPADIRPDFEVLADAYSKIASVVGDLKPGSVPDAATLAKLAKLSGEIDSAKLTTASEHIAAWVQKNCSR